MVDLSEGAVTPFGANQGKDGGREAMKGTFVGFTGALVS